MSFDIPNDPTKASKGFAPIDAWCRCTISKAEEKPNGHAKTLKMELLVEAPSEYKGRKVFASINLIKKDGSTNEFGYSDMVSLACMLGTGFKEARELQGKSFWLKLKPEVSKAYKDEVTGQEHPARVDTKPDWTYVKSEYDTKVASLKGDTTPPPPPGSGAKSFFK